MNTLDTIVTTILYCFTLMATLALIFTIPLLFARILWSVIRRRWHECRKSAWILLILILGFTAGFAAGFSLHPSNWWTVDYVGIDPGKYRNAVEHANGSIFLFLLFCGHIGAILALTSGWFIRRTRRRRIIDLDTNPAEA